MEDNDVAIIVACIAFVSSLLVAMITIYYSNKNSLSLEFYKSEFQKQQTKFASYHTREVEVLAKLYQLCYKTKVSFSSARVSWFMKDQIAIWRDANNEVDKVSFLKHYSKHSEDELAKLRAAKEELEAYFEENLVFIESVYLENQFRTILNLLDNLSTSDAMARVLEMRDKSTIREDDDEVYIRHYHYLENSYNQVQELLPLTLKETRNVIKHIIISD